MSEFFPQTKKSPAVRGFGADFVSCWMLLVIVV
nr:MAG TPA: hypothetical protein [Caudoviricetes sp.]